VQEQLQEQLQVALEPINEALASADKARERGLSHCRSVIRCCGRSIQAIHRGDISTFTTLADEAEAQLRIAQDALRDHPRVAFAGFLHDAEKEYAEARLTFALVYEQPVPTHEELQVQPPAWLNGIAEAASELRRNLLDKLRAGEAQIAERLLSAMQAVYDLLITVDYPDAITAGLRRSNDALRAVLERSRADVTTTVLQERFRADLRDALEH
jgi:translin